MERSVHRILVIGAGSIGERHVRCFSGTGRAEVGIVEPNDSLRAEVARQYSVRAYKEIDDAFGHGYNEAVIATPAPLHVPIAIRLAEQQMHLLIEKPLSVGTVNVDRLVTLFRDRCHLAAVAYVYRGHPMLAAMRTQLLTGRFGRPLQVVAASGQHFPTYRPAYRSTYYADRAAGGGAIQDALTHVINATEWLVGPATRVIADADHKMLEGVSVEDTVNVLARHGEVMASYCLNQHQAPNEVTITVICERGTARWEMHRGQWRWMTSPGGDWHDEPGTTLERDSLFINQATAFMDAIEHRSPLLCTLAEGVQTLRVNLAILASLEHRAWTNVADVS